MNKLGIKILKIVLIISIVSILLSVFTNVVIFRTMFQKLQVEAESTVREAVSSIDGDKLEKVKKDQSMESSEYQEIQQVMMVFKNDKDIKYFYTMAKKDDSMAYILVDAALVDTSPLGEEYEMEESMLGAFNGTPSSASDPVSDDYGTFISAYAPIKNSAGDIIAIAGVDKDVGNFMYIRYTILLSTVIVSAILLILSVLLSILFSRKISSNVKKLTGALKIMSTGDLTVTVNVRSKDEIQVIAESLNAFRVKTAETLGSLRKAYNAIIEQIGSLSAISVQMAASSQEVASTVQQVATGTNSQADEMSNIDNIVDKFGIRIDETVSAIEDVNAKVNIINSKAQVSNQDLTTLQDAIKAINISFEDVRRNIKQLGDYLSKIDEVTNLINNIADQTNLLALNAAIEAARAGESGKGFAVVADEIRKLAEQSKTSAHHISDLLKNVLNQSNSAVETSDITDSKLTEQMTIVKHSLNSFVDIIENVEDIIPKMNHVDNTISQINNEKNEILRSIDTAAALSEEVSASSQEIAASSQQLSASSQEVANLSQNLHNLAIDMLKTMNQFKINN